MRRSPWPARAGRLLFRAACEDDVEAILSFRNDPELNRFTVATFVEPEELRLHVLAQPDSETDFGCVVEEDGEIIALGWLDIGDGVGQPGQPEGTEANIGYLVAGHASGRGVATATARALLTAAFDDLGVRRVKAAAYAANAPSVRVLEKVGMRRERHAVRSGWQAELGWIDEYGYGLLAEEWRQQRAADSDR